MKTWKRISLGTYKYILEIERALAGGGFKTGDWAKDVLDSSSFTLEPREKNIELIRVTPHDLGFYEGAYRVDIYKKAQAVGLQVCPLEVGPQLRLQHTDQPYLESLQIGMEPQRDLENHESEFRVVHAVDHHLWLVGDHKHPNDFWEKDEYFIFCKPRQGLHLYP